MGLIKKTETARQILGGEIRRNLNYINAENYEYMFSYYSEMVDILFTEYEHGKFSINKAEFLERIKRNFINLLILKNDELIEMTLKK